MTSHRALLSRYYLFRDLDPGIVERVGALGVNRRLAAGEVLFRRGDPGDALFGVLRGRLRIGVDAPDGGAPLVLNVVEPGDLFGEIALLDGLPRTADALALDETALFAIHRRDFLPLLAQEADLAAHLIRLLCQRVRKASALIESAALLPLDARLAKHLLGRTALDGAGAAVPVAGLAPAAGAAPDDVDDCLQRWRARGWVTLDGGGVTVADRAALAATAAG